MNSNEIISEVKQIFQSQWSVKEGRQIPNTEDIGLGNEATTLDGAVLYADMSDSTEMVNKYKANFAAEIYKSYLIATCRIIRNNGGEITAFDGDRLMAVFIGDYKNSSAAKAALQINFIIGEINSALKSAYPNTAYTLGHSVGIDTSSLFIARTGIRNSNDLVWVGRAANYAAKLCSLREGGYSIYITSDVFNKLSDELKYGGNPKQHMWEKRMWAEMGVTVYRSNWVWKF